MFDWDDLRYLLALARHGSTLAASRALRVDQSTVQRRIAELERALGCSLVRRQPAGYQLTELGAALLPHAQRVQEAVAAFEQAVTGATREAAGAVRVSCPEPIVQRLVQSGFVERFEAAHPGMRVEFVASDRYVDLMRGDADVALRSGDTDDGELVGRKIGDSLWAVYASARYLAQHGRPRSLAELPQHALIGLDDSMANHRLMAWLRSAAPGGRVVARSNSILGLLQSARAGLGLAALPTAIADAEPDLVRVLGPVDELTRIWRVLVAPDKRHHPRVGAFFDYVVEEIGALRPIITG